MTMCSAQIPWLWMTTSLLTFLAHSLHSAALTQSPAALASSTFSGFFFKSSQRSRSSSAKLTGRSVSLFSYRSSLCSCTSWPKLSGNLVRRLLLMSNSKTFFKEDMLSYVNWIGMYKMLHTRTATLVELTIILKSTAYCKKATVSRQCEVCTHTWTITYIGPQCIEDVHTHSSTLQKLTFGKDVQLISDSRTGKIVSWFRDKSSLVARGICT